MDNYTGPYWSDAKIQESVEFGKTPPLSALDAESRLHDSAYAHYEDLGHRMAADAIYDSRVSKMGGLGQFAGSAVLYGNQTLRAGSNLLSNSKYGPIGLILGALENDYYLYDYMSNVDRYKKEVLAYYDTDPGWDGMTNSKSNTPVVNATDSTIVNETSSDYKHVTRRFASGDDMPKVTGDRTGQHQPSTKPKSFSSDEYQGIDVKKLNYYYGMNHGINSIEYNPYTGNSL